MKTDYVIAWDFDGVLNKNIKDGRFVWSEHFEKDLDQSLAHFESHVFISDFDRIITGQEDLRDRIVSWAEKVDFQLGADHLLDYWFSKDNRPDGEVVSLVDNLRAAGVQQVIATNNEARRSRYIMDDMGFSRRVDHMFASGLMGVKKPDEVYFSTITEDLGVNRKAMILVDDSKRNVDAAEEIGWNGFHFCDDTRDGLVSFLKDFIPDF